VPEVQLIISNLGGIATRAQIVERGGKPAAIAAAVRSGAVRRVRRSHYALPEVTQPALAAVRVGGRLGCVSAAKSYEIWSNSGTRVHVALPANAARLRTNLPLAPSPLRLTSDRHSAALELHWTDIAVGARSDESAWRVPIRRALAQIAACQPRLEIAAAYESAVHLGHLGLADAQRLLDASRPARIPPITLRGIDGSGAETYLAEELLAFGVPFLQQVPFDGVGWVDFMIAGRLAVEVDGFAFHSGKAAFTADRARDEALLGRGIPTLRIPAADVIADPRAAALRVIEALNALP
jgi:very-short-patch-repair endonuclease